MKFSHNLKKMILLFTLSGGIWVSAQHSIISSKELPANTQKFISRNFANHQIAHAQKESKVGIVHEYEVTLNDGTQLEFYRDGSWKEMKNKQNGIALNLVPKKISSYIQQKFPKTFVTKIERERYAYKVDLSNGLDLEFNSDGDFKRIDD